MASQSEGSPWRHIYEHINFTFLGSYPFLGKGHLGCFMMDSDGAECGQRVLTRATDVAAPFCSGGRSADPPMLWRSDLIGRWHVFDLGGCATSTSSNIATSTHHCTRLQQRTGSRRGTNTPSYSKTTGSYRQQRRFTYLLVCFNRKAA